MYEQCTIPNAVAMLVEVFFYDDLSVLRTLTASADSSMSA
jgi:hypothetical protein